MPSVLVVDDDQFVRDLIDNVLTQDGFEVKLAEDGQDALNALTAFYLLKTELPDVIVVDIIMPKKTGLDVIKEVKERYPSIKIIAISGGGRLTPEHYLENANVAGAHYSFSKPLDNDVLLQAVHSLTSA